MKKILIITIALFAVFTLSACNNEEPTELVIYSDFGREVIEKEVYQEYIFDAFEEEHNVTIKFETLGQAQDTFTKIHSEQIAENYSVDLVISHFGTMSEYIDAGYIKDSTDLEIEMDDRTFLTTFDGSTKLGEFRFFFPINSDVYLAYANKSAFTSLPAGVTEADILAGDYTWEDYAAWGAAIGGNSIFFKGLPTSQLTYQIGGMALSNGGAYPIMNDAGNLKAWQDVILMKDNIHPESTTVNVSSDLMASGSVKLAFELMAPLATAYIAAPAQYEVFPGPTGTSGSAGSIVGGHGIGVVANAPNEDLAKEFIKWMTAPEQIVHAALGTIPTILEATTVLTDDPGDYVIKMGLATISNANVEGLQMIPEYISWGDLKGSYDRIFAGILDGSVTLANLQEKLDAEQVNLEDLKK
ncbi:MAG: extracellular solute-binding protein [Tenericutes bacterium]|nr:extracellular solute-binding protein [Mycoplasmatota bacterium]